MSTVKVSYEWKGISNGSEVKGKDVKILQMIYGARFEIEEESMNTLRNDLIERGIYCASITVNKFEYLDI